MKASGIPFLVRLHLLGQTALITRYLASVGVYYLES